MFLSPIGVKDYRLTIITTPVFAGWEASFDGGTSWLAGTVDGTLANTWVWLVAGPHAPSPGSATVLAADLYPLIRPVGAAPEVDVLKAPYIAIATPDA